MSAPQEDAGAGVGLNEDYVEALLKATWRLSEDEGRVEVRRILAAALRAQPQRVEGTRFEGWAKERKASEDEPHLVSHYFAEGGHIEYEFDGARVGDDDGFIRATLIIHAPETTRGEE